jgi:hypothetical protein
MTTIQLKNILIDKIYSISDEEFLLAIKKLMDCVDTSNKIYKLNNEQRNAVNEGKQQIKDGKYISNEDLQKEEDLWLNE